MPCHRLCASFLLPNATGITATQRRLRSRCRESPPWKSHSSLLAGSDPSTHTMKAINYPHTVLPEPCAAVIQSTILRGPALTADRFRIGSTALLAQPDIWLWAGGNSMWHELLERSVLSAPEGLSGYDHQRVKCAARIDKIRRDCLRSLLSLPADTTTAKRRRRRR